MNLWIDDIGDQPNLPEIELISKLWSGAKSQAGNRQANNQF